MLKFASLSLSKRTNKVIASLLAIVILLSTTIGSTMFAFAANGGNNVTITQNIYNSHDINEENEVTAKVGDLSNSLISGKNAMYYNGTAYVDGSADSNFARLTDGKICNVAANDWFNVNFYKSYNYEYGGKTYSGKASRMYYDLGTNYSVNEVVLVDASNNAGSNLTLPSFKVFLSETASEHQLFDVETLNTSYSVTANTTNPGDYKAIVYKITFNQPVDARYIGFEFPENSCAKGVNNVVIYEVAVFGEGINMNNTYYKLTNDKKLNITYLGGSVTSGHGASDTETTSWRAFTTKWFKDNYPNATISAKNGAVGSTGSHLATYHYGLIDQHKTDLLFVDSAINDFYLYNNQRNGKANPESSDAYANTLRNLESLIRNAIKDNPNIEIVFVLTFDHWRVTDASNPSVKAMIDLADKYKLPCIDLRVPLKERADTDGLAWHSDGLKPYRTEDDTDAYEQLYIKGDGVHPNDAGYKIFGDYVTKILKGYMDNASATALEAYTVPSDSLSANLINNPTVITADKITLSSGWTHATKNFSYLHSQYANVYENKGVVTTSTPNSTLTYTFTGTEFGIFAATGSDCGKIYVEVDGVPYKQGANGDFEDGVIDFYQGNNDHRTQLIASGLENKKHTVTIKSLAGTNNNRVEIGAFLVDKEADPDYTITTTAGNTSDTFDTTENLIYGKVPSEFPKADNIGYLTDGNSRNERALSTVQTLSFDMGKAFTIEEIVMITSSHNNRLGEYEIYVADNKEDLYNAENLVAEIKDPSTVLYSSTATTVDTIKFSDSYAKSGKWVGFKVLKKQLGTGNSANFREIIVKGEEVKVPVLPDYTVTTTEGSVNDKLPTVENIIYGKNVTNNSIATSFAHLTDGENKGKGAGGSSWPYKLTYALGEEHKLSEINVISGTNNNRLGAFEVYVSDKEDDLYNAENLKATVTGDSVGWKTGATTIDTVTFKENYASGSFIGIKLTKCNPASATGASWIYEIIVKGEFSSVPNVKTTTTAGTTSDTFDTSKNLIYNKYSANAFKGLTDGVNKSTGVGSNSTNWPVKFTYELDENFKIDKVVITNDASNYGNGKLRLGEYNLYVSNSAEDLYNRENLVANVVGQISDFGANQTVVDTIEFSKYVDTIGTYFGFEIVTPNLGHSDNQARINEIEVFGTQQAPEETLGTRPVLSNVDKNFEYKENAKQIAGGIKIYENLSLFGEAHTNQYVALDYTYNSAVTPVVWAKAITSTESNASVTGYYVIIENGTTTKLYKRTSDGQDTYLGVCGNHTDFNDEIVRLEIITEKVGNTTKITVSTYKTGDDKDSDKFLLMLKNTYYDDTAELQTPGMAGYSVKGLGKTAEIKEFVYNSCDGTAESLSYIENPIVNQPSSLAGQKVILDPAKTYTLTARVSKENTSLAVYYWAANGKMEKGFASVGNISNVGGYRTVTYEFCLNTIIQENGLAAPHSDEHAYNKMAEVFVGFITDKSKVISYSNLSLTEKVSGKEILVNKNLKMGLSGWIEEISEGKWGFNNGQYGSVSSRKGILTLKTNVSQADYDSIFKMQAGETTGIDYSKYDKLMLHINGTGGDYGKVGQFFELEIGASYVYELDFGYDPRNSATPIIFYHTVENSKINSNPATRIEPSSKLSKDGCRTQYIFTVPDTAYKNPETGKATIFVGVSTGKADAKCYFYDFVLYKEKDATKTNLFLNGKFEDGFKHWIVNHNYVWSILTPVGVKSYVQPGTGVELLPYDAAKFQLDDGSFVIPDIPDVDYNNYKGDFMIYIPETVTDTYGKFGQVLYFERNVKYQFTMSFKYIRQNSTKPVVLYYKDDPYATNEYVISKGYVTAKGEADRVKYLTNIRDTVSYDLIMDDANSTQTVEFKVPSDAWKNSEGKSPLFVGLSSGEKGTKCYFANFCVAKEGSKENMLLNADFKQGFLNWICNYGYLINPISQENIFWTNGYTIAQILPYDASIFVNDTNDGLWSDGDWYSVFGEDDAVLDGDNSANSGSSDTKVVIVPGKLNVPATIALYGGIVVIAAGIVIAVIVIKKKKSKQA